MFEYVVVLTGVIIGLAVAHLMQGVAKIVEQPKRVRIWWVHLVWVAQMGLLCMFWWWFEFRLRLIGSWTFQLYAFVLGEAFLLYLQCAFLFPHDLNAHQSFKEYFLARRRWFFGLILANLAIDMLDTWAKCSVYFASLGLEYPITRVVLALLCIAAILSPRERVQGAIVVLVFGYQLSLIARFYDVVR